MEETTDVLSIDLKELIALKDGAGNLVTTPEAEDQLAKILQFKKLADSILEYAKSKLLETMQAESFKKIDGKRFTIIERSVGDQYSVGEDANREFKKRVQWDKPNTEEIELYLQSTGRLPEGVREKAQIKKIQIYEKKIEG